MIEYQAIHTCDRCGAVSEKRNDFRHVDEQGKAFYHFSSPVGWREIDVWSFVGQGPSGAATYCDKCVGEIAAFILSTA